jgi:AcrR family transcriptional regulator
MKKRRYTQKGRAKSSEATRERIVAATVALHEKLGPKATTISAIAKRAGVQRLTVYRHFPDDAALFEACSSHWLAANPPPEAAAALAGGREGAASCRTALATLYAYYRRTAAMLDASHRDEPEVPALRAPMKAFRAYLDGYRDELVASLAPRPHEKSALTATLGHALRFTTWQSLKQERLSDAAIAGLVMQWLAGIKPAR